MFTDTDGETSLKSALRLALATVLSVAALAVTAPDGAASAAPSPPSRYVALGDSYAAEPLVPPADPADLACLRSLAGYPHVAARALGADLTDVSCSAATTGDLSTPSTRVSRPSTTPSPPTPISSASPSARTTSGSSPRR